MRIFVFKLSLISLQQKSSQQSLAWVWWEHKCKIVLSETLSVWLTPSQWQQQNSSFKHVVLVSARWENPGHASNFFPGCTFSCWVSSWQVRSVKIGCNLKASHQMSHYVNLRVHMSIYKTQHLTECLTCQLFSNCIVIQCTHIVLHTHTYTHPPL